MNRRREDFVPEEAQPDEEGQIVQEWIDANIPEEAVELPERPDKRRTNESSRSEVLGDNAERSRQEIRATLAAGFYSASSAKQKSGYFIIWRVASQFQAWKTLCVNILDQLSLRNLLINRSVNSAERRVFNSNWTPKIPMPRRVLHLPRSSIEVLSVQVSGLRTMSDRQENRHFRKAAQHREENRASQRAVSGS